MNKEFIPQLIEYQDYLDRYHTPGNEQPNIQLAEAYLDKFALTSEEYRNKWQLIQNSVFDTSQQLPSMIFRKNFEFISLLGGIMLDQADFERLNLCLQQINEKNIIIIQDTYNIPLEHLQYSLKMKYPSNISWLALMSGNYISVALFEASEDNYYIFGETADWGIYIATEFIDVKVNRAGTPIRIIGFNPKFRSIFRNAFNIQEGEYCEKLDYIPEKYRPDLKAWIPKIYRNQ